MPTMPRTLPILGVMRTMALFPVDSWAEMIWKVYEADPMVCPQCGGRMKVVAFITEYVVVDRIIDHLKLRFIAEKPAQVFTEVALMAAEERAEYF